MPDDDHSEPDTHLHLGRIALAVQACPLVAGLHSGALNAITTRTPAGRLIGVFRHRNVLVVGVIGRGQAPVTEIAAQVRAAVATLAPHLYVTVTVAARVTATGRLTGRCPA